MKERLVEMLQKAEQKCSNTMQCENCIEFGYGDRCVFYLTAEHLISEGVIVPPCKMGDTVYTVGYDFGSIFKCKICTVNYICGVWTGTMENTWVHAHGSLYRWSESNFGNSIFFTKEEAEKALAEREDI